MSFYVTLQYDPSYLNNRQGNFYSDLTEPLNFDTKYEVAVTEFSYCADYYTDFGTINASYYKYLARTSQLFIDKYKLNGSYNKKDEQELYTQLFKKGNFESLINSIDDYIYLSNDLNYEKIIKYYQQLESYLSLYIQNTRFFLKIEHLADLKYDLQRIIDRISYVKNPQESHEKLFLNLKTIAKSHIDLISTFNYTNQYKFSKTIIYHDHCSSNDLLEEIFNQYSSFFYIEGSSLIKKDITNIYKINVSIDSQYFINTDNYIKVKPAKRISNVKQFLIVSDIIDANQFDNRYPVLRSLKVEGDVGEQIFKVWENPHYFKINKTSISRINIRILDDKFKEINFRNKSGPVTVKLHFRKIKK